MSVEEMGGCIPVESVIAFKAHQSGVNDLITSVQGEHYHHTYSSALYLL